MTNQLYGANFLMMPEAIFDNIKTFELSCLKLHTKHNQS